MTSASPLVVRVLSLFAACFSLAACSGEGTDEGTPGGLSVGGAAGAAGSAQLNVGGRAGAPASGASGASGESGATGEGGAAGSGTVVAPDECDCVPVDTSAAEGPGYFVMGEAKDSCEGSEHAFFQQPNPAKCAPATCTSMGAGYYESSCVGGAPVQGEYQSFIDDYATCRPLSLPTQGSALFESALIYWSCSPGDPGPAFDRMLCARHFAPPASAACPAKTFCVPRSAGPVCVRGQGAPLAGWIEGDYYNPSRCTGTTDQLTSPMKVTVFADAGCLGESQPAAPDACTTFAEGAPRAYVIEAPSAQKTPTTVEFLEDGADLHCRP